LLIEKQECCESLILRRSSDMFFNCEMRKEFSNLAFTHVVWMAFAMKENVTANPIDISLLGADRIMFYAQVPANPVEQFWGAGDGSGSGRHVPRMANRSRNDKPEAS
jgi:hypothetical protein